MNKMAPGHSVDNINETINEIVKKDNLIIKCPEFKCYELRKWFEVFKGYTTHGTKFIQKLCSKEDYKTCPYAPENKNKLETK